LLIFNIQLNIIAENPEMQAQLVSSHGMLAVLEVLEGRCSNIVIEKLLQIINLVRYVIRYFSFVPGLI